MNSSSRILQKIAISAATTSLFINSSMVAAEEAGSGVTDGLRLEEIVVTSRKREESLIEVPVAITAVTSKTIERAGVTSVEDVGKLVPSFIQKPSQDPGTNVITVRGVTQVRFSEPPIALVIDGVQASSPDQLTQELFDIERIEVLKGPQGSTYGRNAIGGAVNITTKTPTNEYENRIQAGVAEGLFYSLAGVSSGPIVDDKLLYRAAVVYKDDDGRIRNTTLDENVDAYESINAKARFIFYPSENLTFDLRGSIEDFDGGAAYYYPILPGQNPDKVLPVIGNRAGVGKRNLTDISLKVDYEFDVATLTSITAYSEASAATLGQDLDWLPWPVVPIFFGGVTLDQTRDVKAWSEELRLTSDTNGRLQWLVGAYYLNTKRDVVTSVFLDIDPNASPRSGPQLARLPEENRNDAYALFGSADYEITNDLKLSLGLRQDWDERKQTNPDTLSVVQETFKSLQPKISLTYFMGPEHRKMVYASAGRGFRSGGFNGQSNLFPRKYEAEKATTFELGTKTEWLDRSLQINAAAFYTSQKNVQIFQFDSLTGTQGILTINDAYHYGVEADFRALVPGGFELFGGGSVISSTVQDYDGSEQFKGNDLPHVNGWSYNLGVQYIRDFGDDYTLVGRVDYSAFGDLNWFVDNLVKLDQVHLVNARVSVEVSQWTLTVYAKNLFNRRYNTDYFSAYYAGTPTDIGYPNQPRMIGGSVSLRF